MGLLSGLLGGKAGTPATSSQESQSTSDSLNAALSRARSSSGQSIFGPQSDVLSQQFFPGISQLFGQDPQSFLAGFNPNQLAGQQASLGAANALGGGVIDPSTQAFQSLLGAGGAGAPGVQSAISAATNPIFQNFEERIAPSIRRALGTDVGQAGGSRGGLQLAKAGQDALRTAGDVGSQVALQAQQQGLQAQQGALNFAPQLAQLFGQPGAIQQGIGGLQQQQAQREAQQPLDFMAQLRQLIGAPTVLGQSQSATDSGSFGQSTAQSTSSGQSTGPIAGSPNLLPILAGAGIGGFLGGPGGAATGGSLGGLIGQP